jgi:hypothetical protein
MIDGSRAVIGCPDWFAFLDKRKDQHYFYNKRTKQTTWTMPKPPAPLMAGQVDESRLKDIIAQAQAAANALRDDVDKQVQDDEQTTLDALKDEPLKLLATPARKKPKTKPYDKKANDKHEKRPESKRELFTKEQERQFLAVLGPYVVQCLAPWKNELEKEKFKEYARTVRPCLQD